MTDTQTAPAPSATDPQPGDTFTIQDQYRDVHDFTVLYVDDRRVFGTDPSGEYGDASYPPEDFARLVVAAAPEPAVAPSRFWVEVQAFDNGRFGVNRHEVTGARASDGYEPQSRRDGCQWAEVQVLRWLD